MACKVQPLEGLAACKCSVAYDCHHVVVKAAQIPCSRKAQGSRDGGRGVAYAKHVVGAFCAPRKACQAVLLAQGGEGLCPACEDLEGIALMAHVPDELILVHVELGQKGQGELHSAKARRKMAAVCGADVQNARAHLGCKPFQLRVCEIVQAIRKIQCFQIGCLIVHCCLT